MKLSTKITTVAVAAVVLTALCAAATVRWLAERNRVAALRQEMSVVLSQATNLAASMDQMHRNEAFDIDGLLQRARQDGGGRPLRENYRRTAFYDTIPIVAAWRAAEASAEAHGYEFSTTSRPDLPPRNPKNVAPPELSPAFEAFARGDREYFGLDRKTGELILAQPVRLSASCLSCHGDPADSRTGDGLDVLGFPMEGMKAGDLKGAFVLKTHVKDDPVIASTMKSMAGVTAALIVVVTIGLIVFNRRYVNRPLHHAIVQIEAATEHTSAAAEQVAGSSRTMAEGASHQAASLEETGASLEEMSGMTKQNASNAAAAKATAAQTRASADVGVERMQAMQTAMQEIQSSNEEITKILHTIDDIAFQTNILALNAAVEAARAGPAGAGFAVVADEVRRLAQRSAEAARETARKIEDSIQRSRHGVQLSNDVGEQLSTIRSYIQNLDTLVAGIASASHEQSQGISQITLAISQVDRVTQQSAAGAEEGAAAAEELHDQTRQIKQAVNDLKKFVGANHSQPGPVPKPAPDTASLVPASGPSKAAASVARRRAPQGISPRHQPAEPTFRN
jgi:methyl-accepting chemotaxis protein